MTADAPTNEPDPQASDPDSSADPSPEDAPAPSGDVAAMERALKKANREAETYRRKLKERDDADLSEIEKVRADAAEAKAQLAAMSSRVRQSEVKAIVGPKVVDADVAIALLDVDDLVDSNGNVDRKAVEKAADQLIKDKPYLAATAAGRTPSVPTGARSDAPAGGDDMNARLRRAAGY